MQVVWFKRDIRTHDNEALCEASKLGPILPIYIFEPELWNQADLSHRHYMFLRESLVELDVELQRLGQKLIFRTGDAIKIFNGIHENHQIKGLWSHQETWNNWTYKRDQKIKKSYANKKIKLY